MSGIYSHRPMVAVPPTNTASLSAMAPPLPPLPPPPQHQQQSAPPPPCTNSGHITPGTAIQGLVANTPSAVGGMTNQRIVDLLEALKSEVEMLVQESSLSKMQRDELEHKVNQQIPEMTAYQQNLYELERAHQKIRQHYEEEVARLRRELDQHQQMRLLPGASSSVVAAPAAGTPDIHVSVTLQPPNVGHAASASNGAGVFSRISSGNEGAYPPQHANGAGIHSLHPHPSKRHRADSDATTSILTPIMSSQLYSGASPLAQQAASTYHQKQEHPPAYHPPAGPALVAVPRKLSGGDVASVHPLPAPSRGGTPTPVKGAGAEVPANGTSSPGRQGVNAVAPERGGGQQPPEKEGWDWYLAHNPHLPRLLNIELVHAVKLTTVVCCVRFSNDGKYVAAGSNQCAQVFDVATGAEIAAFSVKPSVPERDWYIRAICFNIDNTALVTGSENHDLCFWDISSKKVTCVLSGHLQDIYSLDFSPDGRLLASGSGDQTIRIWEVETGNVLHTINLHADGEGDPPDSGVTSVMFSRDSRFLVAGSLDKVIRIYNVQRGVCLALLEGHKDSVYSVAFTPDSKYLISGSLDKTAKYWDVSFLASINANECAAAPKSFGDSHCKVVFTGHTDFVLSVTPSADSKWVLSASKDRTVQVWDSASGQLQLMLQGHTNSVISIASNPIGDGTFATGSGDYFLKIWRMENVLPAK